MRISMRKLRRAAGRPGALPNPRRICGHKSGAPTPQKGVRCEPPTCKVYYLIIFSESTCTVNIVLHIPGNVERC